MFCTELELPARVTLVGLVLLSLAELLPWLAGLGVKPVGVSTLTWYSPAQSPVNW